MKNVKRILLYQAVLSLVLAACQGVSPTAPPPTQSPPPSPNPTAPHRRDPVHMEIPKLGIDFPLVEISGDDTLPYESGPAFWLRNRWVFDVASHCGELPGDRFTEINLGDTIKVTFDDGSTRDLVVYEIILIRYSNLSNPYMGNWVDQYGKEYTPMEATTYLVTRPINEFMLHSSTCTTEFSVGQRFMLAK